MSERDAYEEKQNRQHSAHARHAQRRRVPTLRRRRSRQLNLANHFLIAMPSMEDPIFGGTVVYICEHNDKGVLGVVINKPTDMTMEVLFDRIDLKLAEGLRAAVVDEPIMFGGPVQDDRGFVLHTPGGALFVAR